MELHKILEKAIVLRGEWNWKTYKTYDTDFGWCVYAADAQAKKDMANLFEHTVAHQTANVFIRVKTRSGKEEIVGLPQQCFDDNRELRWFEFSKKTLKTLEKDYKKACKDAGVKPNFQVVEL